MTADEATRTRDYDRLVPECTRDYDRLVPERTRDYDRLVPERTSDYDRSILRLPRHKLRLSQNATIRSRHRKKRVPA